MITYDFANQNQANQLLSTADEYTRNISPFSLQAVGCRGEQDLLRFLSSVGRNFTRQEQARIDNFMIRINQRLQALNLEFNLHMTLVKTSGRESMGMPYTRQNFVVFTEPYLQAEGAGMNIPGVNMGEGLLAHEIFHVISRAFPQKRNALYALHGFEYNPAPLPRNLAVLTNPDAPNADYTVQGLRPVLAVTGFTPMAMMEADKQVLTERGLVHRNQTNYLDVVRPNSNYSAYHPEEISAENFRLLIEDRAFPQREEFIRILRP